MQVKALRGISNKQWMTSILAISGGVFLFLIWLIYFNKGGAYTSSVIGNLPAVNAVLNGLSTIFLTLGFIAIKGKKPQTHMRYMIAALVSSSLFLISYVIYQLPR